ncbi:type II toxin-antitoxin system RelE/ParE family toxin [Pseudanabaena sp. SR411]|uniref:type II toxin-antitoxin system RelE family toxin n=1 Tax=Pseudanabaena sp. SR411 TaxID=1980935 RepID=UPI0020CD4A16|nr:hypothetical protein [Pseudanabaena sp. SR411]
MTYYIEFAKPAAKQLKALSPQEQQRIKSKIDALVDCLAPMAWSNYQEKMTFTEFELVTIASFTAFRITTY